MSERQLRLALDGPPEPAEGGLSPVAEVPSLPQEEIVSLSSNASNPTDEGAAPDEALADDELDGALAPIHEPTLWRDLGWTAEVIHNEDGEGWAVAMSRYGELEPALVGPWVMGRDKKNPKPMNDYDFRALVKAASDVMKRHEQQLRAQLHRRVVVYGDEGRVDVTLDIVPDEDEPHAILAARDERGELLAEEQVSAAFRLNEASAEKWVAGGFGEPR